MNISIFKKLEGYFFLINLVLINKHCFSNIMEIFMNWRFKIKQLITYHKFGSKIVNY